MSGRTLEWQVADLRLEVHRLQQTVGTLISWISQSANSPIRTDEAATLLKMIDGLHTKEK